MSSKQIKIKTDLEKQLYDCYINEKTARQNLEVIVNDLKGQIQSLQVQLQSVQLELQNSKERDKNDPEGVEANRSIKFSQRTEDEYIEYCTDEDDLAKETEWIRAKSRKKRKLNTSLTPPQQPSTSAQQYKNKKEKTEVKKPPPPPPIVVDQVKNYQNFYDILTEMQPAETFTAKMMNRDCVKVNAKTEDSYRIISRLLAEKNYHWHSYEDKQTRPIRVVVKKLPSSCQPDRIKDDLTSQGFYIEKVDNKLSWKNKEPLNMFILSFKNDEDVNKIYGIKHILGCKVEIHPLKNSKLIPQCKRCQAYGHTQKYCSKEPRCVKCTGKHLTPNCNKPAQEKPKCVHCGLPHPANYRGCVVAKEIQKLRNKNPKGKPVAPISQQSPHVTHSDQQSSKASVQSKVKTVYANKSVSYAQVAKQNTQSTNFEDKLNQILKCISSFDKRLEKLESSTKAVILKDLQ